MISLAIYCGSKRGNKQSYSKNAKKVGQLLAKKSIELIYGGGNIGLMGDLADSVLDHGGKVTGVIPDFLFEKEVAHQGIQKLIRVQSMHERKLKMHELSEGIITLPGGFGTMEELFEMITWNHLKLHNKPIGLLNIDGYYNHLIKFIEFMKYEDFIYENTDFLIIDDDADELIERLIDYYKIHKPSFFDQRKT